MAAGIVTTILGSIQSLEKKWESDLEFAVSFCSVAIHMAKP